MSEMPIWLQYVQVLGQALFTPVIAAAVGVIAFLQWRTQHQRVVMDLFDRRMKVYQQATELYREVVRNGISVDVKTAIEFHAVRNEARFLFGDDMTNYLKTWHEALIDMATSASMMREIDGDDRRGHVKKAHENLKTVIRFGEEFPKICARYMRMDQRAL